MQENDTASRKGILFLGGGSPISSSPSLDFAFENKVFPCYAIKLFPERDEVQIHRDRKCLIKFRKSSFPASVDWNNEDTIFGFIRAIREAGNCQVLLKMYPAIELLQD